MSATRHTLICLAISFVVGSAQSASAMETEVALNEDMAIKGGITPGDAPGYPITITHPGRYRLTSNLYPPGEISGIEIKSYGVTIEFDGFILSGDSQGDFGIFGSAVNNVMIMNGFITGFKNPAIIGHDSWIVENMRIANNSYGIKLGDYARVLRSTITWNAAYAINCENYCHAEGNVISNNYEGVHINSGTVLGNTIMHNRTFGIVANSAASKIGFGNNTLLFNNLMGAGGSNAQVHGYSAGDLMPLQPNACSPAC
jgi:hypothetical protein